MNNIIVLFAEPSIVAPAYCTVMTALSNIPPDTSIRLFCLDFPEPLADQLARLFKAHSPLIEIQVISSAALFGPGTWRSRNFGMGCWGRLYLDQLLSDEFQRVLYLDCDMLVLRNLTELIHSPLHGKVIGACHDQGPFFARTTGSVRADLRLSQDGAYLNSGLLLFDWVVAQRKQTLPQIRKYLPDPSNIDRYRSADQDVLNVALDGGWHRLDPRWNMQPQALLHCRKFEPWIAHFVGAAKPWLGNVNAEFTKFASQYSDLIAASGLPIMTDAQSKYAKRRLFAHYLKKSFIRPIEPVLARYLPWLFRKSVRERILLRRNISRDAIFLFEQMIEEANLVK